MALAALLKNNNFVCLVTVKEKAVAQQSYNVYMDKLCTRTLYDLDDSPRVRVDE